MLTQPTKSPLPHESGSGNGLFKKILAGLALIAGSAQAQLVSSCPAGQYLALDTAEVFNGRGLCVTCPRGSYCPSESPQITAPRRCKFGYYSGFGKSSCTECDAGWYCARPEDLPKPCPKGQYSIAGSNMCYQCEDGSVCDGTGSQTLCTAGQICAQSDAFPVAIECPAGYKCPDGGTMTACDAGWYSTTGQGFCTECAAGTKCPTTSHPPLTCPKGTYQDAPGSTDCTECPAGKICPNVAKPPESCPPGTYSILARSTACVQCPAGVSCDTATGTLTACADGEYSIEGMSDCIPCPAGFECSTKKSVGSECTTAGTYSMAGDMHCLTCPAGSYCPLTNAIYIKCSAGYYSPAKQTACTECPAGSSCEDPADVPRKCPFGTNSAAGQTFCTGCPVGAICGDEGSVEPCGIGYLPNQDGTQCVECPAGLACPAKQWDKMVMCPKGYYSLKGEAHCTVSPAGKYARTTTEEPIECDDGYFADIGATYCTQCPPGFECKDKTGRHNSICPPGSFYTGDGECQDCTSGTFCPISIGGYRSEGITCVDGTYAPEGSFDCELCKPGYDCSVDTSRATTGSGCVEQSQKYQIGGSGVCSACPANHECPFSQTVVRCPVFSFSSLGDGICQACPDGKDCQDFTQQEEAPQECAAGYYSQPLDFMCVPCPKGHYCPALTTRPMKCAGGTYAYEGQDTCEDCPAEYYSLEGQEYCSPVPPGYRINDTQDGITVCLQTTYSRWGEEACSTCQDGFLCPEMSTEPSAWHNSCPKGSYCIGGVQTKCPAGKFGTMERGINDSVCVDCPPGYNCQPGTADFELVPCPKGGYCEAGTPVKPCPAGTFNEQLYGRSVSDCKTCPIGHQCGQESTDNGAVCEEGFYCPRGSGDGSYPCPAGTHGNSQKGKKDVNECIPCPPGHYCPEGSGSPTPSPAGYFTPLSGMPSLESLYLCPPKHYCPDTAMVTYKGNFCEPGYVCPAGSTSPTQVECPAGTYSDRTDLHDTKHCNLCPKGLSCDTHSTTTNGRMVACPEHRYCPAGTKPASIPVCPPGTYAPFTNAKSLNDCLECPAGKYCLGRENSGSGLAEVPQDCEPGHYCPPGTAYADQSPCPPGYYNPDTGKTSLNDCFHCGFNKYCPDYGTEAPLQCPGGTYNSESTSQAYCSPCEAGYACNQDGTFVYPIPCSAGFYSAKGAEICIPCPVGTYCPNQATSDADLKNQLCPKGTLCKISVSYTNMNSVLETVDAGIDTYPNKLDTGHACPLYKYCPKGTSKALDIPRGTMQELWARGSLADAIQMPAGNYSLAQDPPADPPYVTTVCPVGHYCPPGSFEKVPCPTGYFRANTNGIDADSCGFCPAGTYCASEGTSVPDMCTAGHFCPEGSAEPVPCPRGTYYTGNNVDGDPEGLYDSRGCTPCDAGYYCPFMGQTAVDTVNHQCDAGYYCIAGSSRPEPTDQVTGSRCPPGGYCLKGASAPAACPAGKYGPYEGAQSEEDCIDCKPGYYCLGNDATDATSLCKAGYFCSGGTIDYNLIDGAYDKAGEAQPGFYAPEGSYQQIECPEGTYSPEAKAEECISCIAGYFCDAIGLSARPDCGVGYYCPSYEYFVQEAADISADEVVKYRRIPCEPGTYSYDPNGSTSAACLDCPATFACEKRAIGDASEMVLCAAGYFCKTGADSRYPTSSSNSGPCPAGHYCAEGTKDPEPCPAGTFNPQEYSTDENFCLPCPPGYKCEGTGNSWMTSKCDAGTHCTDGLSQTGCGQSGTSGVHCPLGAHFELFCPMGYYQPNVERGYCFECPAGSFCMNGLATVCDAGYYCP